MKKIAFGMIVIVIIAMSAMSGCIDGEDFDISYPIVVSADMYPVTFTLYDDGVAIAKVEDFVRDARWQIVERTKDSIKYDIAIFEYDPATIVIYDDFSANLFAGGGSAHGSWHYHFSSNTRES